MPRTEGAEKAYVSLMGGGKAIDFMIYNQGNEHSDASIYCG